MVESRDNNQGKSTMQVDNDTIFNLLMDLKSSNASIQTEINSLNEKIDQSNRKFDELKQDFNTRIDGVEEDSTKARDKAQEALEKSKQLEKDNQQKNNTWTLIWLPILIAFIPTILGHIHLQ